jgi:carbamoyltransferase
MPRSLSRFTSLGPRRTVVPVAAETKNAYATTARSSFPASDLARAKLKAGRDPERWNNATVLIAGVSVGATRDGLPLKDGAACLVEDGRVVVAIAEERLTRRKHAGGFAMALPYCLDAVGATLADVDLLVVSTCAEPPLGDGANLGLDLPRDRVRSIPSHHLSHAYSAFLTSSFESAAIMVLDNEGTALDRGKPARIERQSYYLGKGQTILPLPQADDGLLAGELGVGQVYRHLTYFLGWPSYVYAGHTMGLAPYGSPWAFSGAPLFDLTDGRVRARIVDGGADPPGAVSAWAESAGIDIGPRRQPDEPLTPLHADLAAHAQSELERALVYKAERLYELTNERNLCIAGGVALNCVANRRLLDATPFERLYVFPAPGDSGQCVGNALYGWTDIANGERSPDPITPYLGREYTDEEMRMALEQHADSVTFIQSDDPAGQAGRLLAGRNVIAWFQGRSELGPRALGSRSILADPRPASMRDYLNRVIKRRAPFRPVAPSILLDHVSRFCDLPQPSPFMELTATIAPDARHLVPAITHTDGSSRPQTLSPHDNPLYERVLTEFQTATGLPLVLNTSFNLDGEPIVESPADAIACLMASQLDALILGPYVVRRRGHEGPGIRLWQERGG